MKKGKAEKNTWSLTQCLTLLSLITLIFLIPFCESFNYGQALSKSLLYFESQRSGRLPHNQRVTWRHHSGLTDGLEQGVHNYTLHITYYYVFLCAYVHFIHFNMVIVFWARLGGLSGRILWCRGQCEIWTTNGIHHYSPLLGCFRIRRTNRRRRRVCPRAWGHQVGDWLFHQGPLTTKCSLGRGISNFAFTSHNSSIFLNDVTPRAAFEIGINNPSKLTGGICSNVGAVSCFNADSRWLARSVTRGWTFKIETLDKKM